MPFQILQKGPTFGQGALLGLGQNLQELASNKLQQIKQANEQSQFAQTLRNANFEPGVANLIASLPINDRLKALQPFLGDTRFNSPQPQTAVQPVIPEAVIQEPTIHAAATKQQFNELAGQQPKQPSSYDLAQEMRRTALGFPETFSPDAVKDVIKQFQNMGEKITPKEQKQIQEQAQAIAQDPAKLADYQKRYEQAVKNNEMIELRKPGYTGAATPIEQIQQQQQSPYRQPITALGEKEKAALRKEEAAKIQSKEKELARGEKESKAFYDSTVKEARAAKESDKRLDRMEKLIKKGNLPTALWYNFFTGLSEIGGEGTSLPIIGPIIGLLANPIGGLGLSAQRAISSDVEEFEKLSADFIKDAKNFFPGRVTNADLNAFLKTIPTLSQTDQGKINIIENMRSFNKVSKLREQASKSIIRENNNRRPGDLELLVDEKISKQLDKIADDFKNRIGKSVEYEPRDRYLFGLLPKLPSSSGF